MASSITLCGLIVNNASAISGSWNDNTSSQGLSKDNEGYYLIKTNTDLASINKAPGTYFGTGTKIRLCANINMSAHFWEPINSQFKGTFDGNGYTISNITMKAPESDSNSTYNYAGLFSQANKANIKNLNLSNFTIYGVCYAGALVGDATNNSIIEMVTVKNSKIYAQNFKSISTANTYIQSGGIAGHISESEVINCACVSCNVYSQNVNSSSKDNIRLDAGGIVGCMINSEVSQCYSASSKICSIGEITKKVLLVPAKYDASYAKKVCLGGIVGECYMSGGGSCIIQNCYNTSTVTSYYERILFKDISVTESCVGGIVGTTNSSIIACYNTGSVSGYANGRLSVGDSVRLNDPIDPPFSAYYSVTNGEKKANNTTKKVISYTPSYVGGIVGYSSGTISNCYNTGTVSNEASSSVTEYRYGFILSGGNNSSIYGVKYGYANNILFCATIDGEYVTRHSICGNSTNKITNSVTTKSLGFSVFCSSAQLLFGLSSQDGDALNFVWSEEYINNCKQDSNKHSPKLEGSGKLGGVDDDGGPSKDAFLNYSSNIYRDDYMFSMELFIDSGNDYIELSSIMTDAAMGRWDDKTGERYVIKSVSGEKATNDVSTQNLNNSLGSLSSTYYALDPKINGGLPHLKCFYWQDNASID